MLRITKTENGMVRGAPGTDARITVFKGIPFADDTSGENRWRPAQPVKDWVGIRDCLEFGPIPMQKTPGEDPNAFYSKEWHVDPQVPMGEDCLRVNIWTPAKKTDEKLPVMVWIFGGGYKEGYPHEMEFDGERIASRGVILVSVAYRVNVFGFLCHPDITAENPEAPANLGLLDQRAGIAWVKRNIANFGGDPENITIFGQSAGGGSTLYHCTSPQTKGLFQKAIAESAGGVKMVKPNVFLPMATELKEAEAIGEKFVREVLGCSSIEEARKLDAQFIEDKYIESGAFMQAVIDHKYILGQSYDQVLADQINDIILMYGNTTDEFMQKPDSDDVEGWARKLFADPKDAEEYLAVCKAAAGEDPVALRKEAAICGFDINAKMSGTVMAKHGHKFYYYVFGPTIPGDDAGAFHSSDLWFEFETLMKCWRPFDGHHYDIARKMCNYWTNFAKTGDPNGDDADGIPMPQWRPFTLEDPCTMYFKDQVYSDNKPFSGKTKFLVEKNLAEYEY